MRLVVFGTGPFAAPMFRALYDSPHTVAALVTQPPRKVHGKDSAASNPLRSIAAERGTPVFDPADVNAAESLDEIRKLAADLFVVADYGQILSDDLLAVARLGGINLHGSLLPKYRGAAPINWAIYHGDTETGVTVIQMTPRVDAGPALAQAGTPIGPDETAPQLEARLAALGAPLIVRVVDDLAAGRARPLAQDRSLASGARRLRKTDGAIDWSHSAAAIKNQVRALEPWPKTYTYWHREGGPPLRLILGRVDVQPSDETASAPGTVLAARGDELRIAAGGGALTIIEIQPEGRRLLPAAEFLRGYPVRPGQRFGPE
jgi:methionyl-tRNA formyltransferase